MTTRDEFLQRIRDAHQAGKLGYHSKIGLTTGRCLYSYSDDRNCAIGAALGPAAAQTLTEDICENEANTRITGLIDLMKDDTYTFPDPFVELANTFKRSELLTIQAAHDGLVGIMSLIEDNVRRKNIHEDNIGAAKQSYKDWLETIGLPPEPDWDPVIHVTKYMGGVGQEG